LPFSIPQKLGDWSNQERLGLKQLETISGGFRMEDGHFNLGPAAGFILCFCTKPRRHSKAAKISWPDEPQRTDGPSSCRLRRTVPRF